MDCYTQNIQQKKGKIFIQNIQTNKNAVQESTFRLSQGYSYGRINN